MEPSKLIQQIKKIFPNLIQDASIDRGDAFVVVKKEGLKDFCSALRQSADFKFDLLMDLFGVDYLHWEEKGIRFEVVYNLFSTEKNHRLFVKVPVHESETTVESVSSVWPAANW